MDEDPAGASGAAEAEPLVLRTPAQFKALGHPVRHRIVNVLRQQPATLRQLASATGLAKGTISFHLRVLREAGLVRLAETRQVRGGTEQYFALVSRGFKLPGDAGAGAGFLLQAALAEMLPARDGQDGTDGQDDAAGQTILRHLWLSPGQASALTAELHDLASRRHPDDPASGEAFGLLVSLYRADIPKLPAADDH